MSKKFCDIYRGYELNFNPDHDGVYIMKDGVKIHTESGMDAAYNWVDKKRREENKK